MTYYDLVCQPPSPQPLPVSRQLMGAWTSQPGVAQRLFALGIPVWLVRASHVVGPDVRVHTFVASSPPDALRHTKFHGSEPIYEGLAGEPHLAATFTVPMYRDISWVPTANPVDPDDYCVRSRGDGQTSNRRVPSALESGEQQGPSSRSRPKNKPKAKQQRISPCKELSTLSLAHENADLYPLAGQAAS